MERDVLVIGGGINGTAIARDLAGRGLSVALCEKNDLASATSGASSKLIHGGLRYLEYGEFRLVHEALKEREVMMRTAPHIIWPMTFVLPHQKKMRPAWMIRLGLFLYDLLGGRKSLEKSKGAYLTGTTLGQPLKAHFRKGFTYADCWVEDTRLVILNALDAFEKGAQILTHTACVGLHHHADKKMWHAQLQDTKTGAALEIHAHMVVNAAGPWVDQALKLAGDHIGQHHVRWVKGSHIIVPRLYQGDHAYILQNDDGRVVFVIPYEKKYSLIGTTDIEYKGDLDAVRIDIEEVEYLCRVVSEYFRHKLTPADVAWTYSGVRPLVDDGTNDPKAVTRDYLLELDDVEGLPILSVYGGKITTSRKLAENVADKVVETLGQRGTAWTADAPLPGGEASGANFKTFFKTMKREFNWLPDALAQRLARSYGARARDVLRGCKRLNDMGINFGDHLYEAEVRYLMDIEWAESAEDILWRRSKLGLHVDNDVVQKLEIYVSEYLTIPPAQRAQANLL